MCSAAHGWMGLGRLVYAVSAAQLAGWRAEWGLPDGAVRVLAVTEVAPGVVVDGPSPELEDEMRELHRRAASAEARPPAGAHPTARALGLERHPEGGWFRQTWRAPTEVTLPDGRTRPTATLIWFLLPAGDASAWHRVASDEVWLAHEGTVRLQLGGTDARPRGRCGARRRRRRRGRPGARGRRTGGSLAAHPPRRPGRARALPGVAGVRLRGLPTRFSASARQRRGGVTENEVAPGCQV